MNVEMLLVRFWVETHAKNHNVKLIEWPGRLTFIEEQRVQLQKAILVLVDQKTT